MGKRVMGSIWAAVVALGCHGPAALPARPPLPTALPTPVELPPVSPTSSVAGVGFRGLTEQVCQSLAAQNAPAANLLDDENRAPPSRDGCETPVSRTRRMVRYYTALEFRNQSAAAGLERFFQLSDAEARSDLLRKALPVIERLKGRAEKAKAAGVRYPLDPAELDRQRGQLLAQQEEADAGVKLLNLDLRRRLGLPPAGDTERLWPAGEFGVDPNPVDEAAAVEAALTDRPELRAWRALHAGLNPDTLAAVREQLRAVSPLLGAIDSEVPGSLCKLLLAGMRSRRGPDAAARAELEVRKRQLEDIIASRERAVSDETRAAVVGVNAQLRRVALARSLADGRKAEWDDAIKRRAADLPGAELAEAQAEVEWLKAKAEVAAESAAWHQARVRLKAAQGRLAWETAPAGGGPQVPGAGPGCRVSCR